MKKIVLEYRRLHEQIDGEYPYTGRFLLLRGDEEAWSMPFVQLVFKELVKKLHTFLKNDEQIERVLLQRTEREDILPMELNRELIQLVRVDPLSAYRAMSYEPQGGNQDVLSRMMSQDTAKKADVFGEVIFLDMANGNVLDPLTGEWRSLAYGERHGWRINAGDNKPDAWLPIELVDDAPAGTQFAFRMAFARWAMISVYSLLARCEERYYLPRSWNPHGTWISHDELKELLEGQQRKEA